MSIPNTTSKAQIESPGTAGARLVPQWPSAPPTIRLDPGQIHLWAAVMDEFGDRVENFRTLLSPVEQAFAQKFKFLKDHSRYVIRHGLLRLILSRYLEKAPSEIEFQYGRYGKPELRRDSACTSLFFNVSHSSSIAIIAVTSACPVGVDVECTRDISEMEGIARRFFLPNETQSLLAQSIDSRVQAFYACWTRKEAFLKATGEGIAESLANVEVTLAPGQEPRVVSVLGDEDANEQWRLQPFSPAPGYLGCVAYRNPVLALSSWHVSESTLGELGSG